VLWPLTRQLLAFQFASRWLQPVVLDLNQIAPGGREKCSGGNPPAKTSTMSRCLRQTKARSGPDPGQIEQVLIEPGWSTHATPCPPGASSNPFETFQRGFFDVRSNHIYALTGAPSQR